MKRFYKIVTTAPGSDGFHIHLDGKPVKTPDGKIIVAPNEALAAHIAAEWAAQVTEIDPETMPMTQILVTCLSGTPEIRADIEKNILGYLNTDLLCYRTVMPEVLAERQAALWDKWLDWFAVKSGVRLETTNTLSALQQDQKAHDYLAQTVRAMNGWVFNVMQIVTGSSGSVILGLAFIDGAATPDDVFSASLVDEIYRASLYNELLYGPDPHQQKIHTAMMRDLNALRLFLDAIPR